MTSVTVGPAGSTRFSTRRCGTPSAEPVHRPVPAVDRAVVQDEFGEVRARRPRRAPAAGPRRRRSAAAAGSSAGSPRRGRTRSRSSAPRTRCAAVRPGACSSGGRVSVACWNSGGLRLAPQLPAEQEGRVGAEGDLHGGDRLRGVPHVGEAVRRHLEVQLHGGARRLRARSRGRSRRKSLDALDVEDEILAARGRRSGR